MAFLAEWLPVVLIPEQLLISPMREDMIHHRRGHDLALRLAKGAQRMLLQEKSASLTPAGIVPTGIRSAAQPVAAPFHMILTDHLTLLAEARTSGIAAGSSWFIWHFFIRLNQESRVRGDYTFTGYSRWVALGEYLNFRTCSMNLSPCRLLFCLGMQLLQLTAGALQKLVIRSDGLSANTVKSREPDPGEKN